MIQTLTLQEIYNTFLLKYPTEKLSFVQFKMMKPWNLIKAYRETCLCRQCEIFRLFMHGMSVVACAVRTLIKDGGENCDVLDDVADGGAVNSEDANEAEMTALYNFCILEHKSQMADALVCGGNVMRADMDCINGKCPRCGFKSLWSCKLRPKLVNEDGELLDGASHIWLEEEMKWETLKSSASTPSDGSSTEEKQTLRAQRTGSIVSFLDCFEAASVTFPSHRHLVNDAKAKAEQRDQNLVPGMLLSDYDWSENGVITPDRQIQSEYWSLTHFSLFISITAYLDPNAWLTRHTLLKKGTQVTVEPEGMSDVSLQPASGSYWAKVHEPPLSEGENSVYSVQKADGSVIGGVTRDRLRHRKKYTTAFVCVTDEKRHDSISSQHFLNRQFQHWLQHVDVGHFWAWAGHSDNASHFKSGAMLHYWSNKMSELPFLKACWIEFGCPGHGKGPWDGMGAVMKQQLKRDMTNNNILTQSGYVRTPSEAAEHLERRFQTEEWRLAHADKPINEVVVLYSHHDEITERPAVEHAFEGLTGKMSSYSYMMLDRDQIARRERSCWCEACSQQRGRQTLTPSGRTLICTRCASPFSLPWHEQTVKDLGTGIAGRRKEAQCLGAQLAPMLKAQAFMAIQAREQWSVSDDLLYRPGHFWVAQAPDVLEIRKISKRETINSQPFNPGDYAIRIGRYFERDASDSSGLTFEEWQPDLVFTPDDVSIIGPFHTHTPCMLPLLMLAHGVAGRLQTHDNSTRCGQGRTHDS